MNKNVKVAEGTTQSVGSVTITIEAYNDIMKELTIYRNAISVKETGWRNEVDMVIDTKVFYNVAKELVEEEFPSATMRKKKEVYEVTTAIATLPSTEAEEE